jgi:hypothetical protein
MKSVSQRGTKLNTRRTQRIIIEPAKKTGGQARMNAERTDSNGGKKNQRIHFEGGPSKRGGVVERGNVIII